MDMNRQEWKEKAAEMSGVPKDVAWGSRFLRLPVRMNYVWKITEE